MVRSQITSAGAPHLPPNNDVPGLPIYSNSTSTVRNQKIPSKASHTAPINTASYTSIPSNASNTVRCQLFRARALQSASTNNVPDLPLTPKVPSSTNTEIAQVRASLSTPLNTAPSLAVALNAPNLINSQIMQEKASPIHNTPGLSTAPNVSSLVSVQMAQERAATSPQQNPPPIVQQRSMAMAYPVLMINLPSALPKVMRTVECSVCNKNTQTDEYTYVDCSNPNCHRRICLLDNCFQGVSRLYTHNFVQHQYNTHLRNANPYQCYSCKAPKRRGRKNLETDSCKVCRVNWCLVGNCTFETPFLKIRSHVTNKHKHR